MLMLMLDKNRFDETIEELMTGEKNCKCFFPLQNVRVSFDQFFNPTIDQKLWVGWQSLISFLIPVLIILASWTIMGYSILNKKVHRWEVSFTFHFH